MIIVSEYRTALYKILNWYTFNSIIHSPIKANFFFPLEENSCIFSWLWKGFYQFWLSSSGTNYPITKFNLMFGLSKSVNVGFRTYNVWIIWLASGTPCSNPLGLPCIVVCNLHAWPLKESPHIEIDRWKTNNMWSTVKEETRM